ncbi:EpsG family protein [Xenorhabdus bovienii]|uniref:EpsG family protein n=1 Tax=Xenorhabdus bovienii TaxID=40576 RepID=UPI002A71D670|nr:EpsG family protein [Xenorhabdus bovienii]
MSFSIFYYYLPLSLLSILEIITKNKKNKFFCFFSSTILTIFFIGLSYKLGVDWVEYIRIYEGSSTQIDHFEKGYILLNNFLNFLGINFWFYHITLKIIFLLLLISFIRKYSQLPVITLSIFIGLSFPFINDPLRQLIATCILLTTFLFFNRPPKLIGILMGFLFHSSFIVICVSWISKIKKKQLITLFILLYAFYFLIITNMNGIINTPFLPLNFIFEKINFYIKYSSSPNLISTFLRIIFLLFICLSIKIKVINSSYLGNDVFKYFWVFSLTCLFLELTSILTPIFSQRMRLYLLIFPIVLFSNYLYSRPTIFKIIVQMIMISYCSISLYLFTEKKIGGFYSLDKNIIVEYLNDYPNKNISRKVDEFWIKR